MQALAKLGPRRILVGGAAALFVLTAPGPVGATPAVEEPTSAPAATAALSRTTLQQAFSAAGAEAQRVAEDAAAQRAASEQAAAQQTDGSGEPAAVADAAVSSSSPVSGAAASAVSAALSRVGSSYVSGGSGPSSFDCSGLTMWAYSRAGVSLPHYSGAQMAAGRSVSLGDMQPGDLMFFGSGGSRHVAMYIGGGQVVHATNPRRGVVSGTYEWEMARGDFAGVRRYV